MPPHIEGPLYTERLGRAGPPMAFVHPNPTDLSVWLYQMAHFSTWFRTVGIDLPGYGRSPKAFPGLTMTDLANACWDAVDANLAADGAVDGVGGAGTAPTVLAGCSVGAHVVLHMAAERPERTAAVILSGTSYFEEKTYCVDRTRFFSQLGVGYRRDYFFDVVSKAWGATDLGGWFADLFTERDPRADVPSIIEMFNALYAPDPDWLFEVKAPVLIISGTEDRSHAAAKVLGGKIAGSEFIPMPGAGHACQVEQPWLWDRWAIDFLGRHGLMPEHGSGAGGQG